MKNFKVVSLLLACLMAISMITPYANAAYKSEENGIAPHSELCVECRQGEVYLHNERLVIFTYPPCPSDPSAYHITMIDGIHYLCRECGAYNGSKVIYRSVVNECSAGIH